VKHSISTYFRFAIERSTQVRAAKVSFFVGTILNAIYQGPEILASGTVDWTRFVLTYLVPYCVATVVSVSTVLQHRNEAQ
jgi:hypothetical protein